MLMGIEEHAALKSLRLELRRKSSGRHSEIFEYESRERSVGVIVKQSTDPIEDPKVEAAVLREFEALQTVRKCLPSQLQDTVPRPLMVFKDSGALVLEAVSGASLKVVLKRDANKIIGPLRSMRMATLGQVIGQWLKQLHEATRKEAQPHSSAEFLAVLDYRLERCRAIGLNGDEIDETKRLLSSASHAIEGFPTPAAARQGDFIPQNILIDGNRVRVVDFENFAKTDCIYQDVATFLSYVQALSAFPYYSHGALLKLSRSFLHGYGLTGRERPLRLYVARSIIWLISELKLDGAFSYGRKRLQFLSAQLQHMCRELAYE
jgi:hypothetical protein